MHLRASPGSARGRAQPQGRAQFVVTATLVEPWETLPASSNRTKTRDVPGAKGTGPYPLDHALRSAWSTRPQRIWLHTDTWDHPKAIATYQRAGFKIYAQRFEVFPD